MATINLTNEYQEIAKTSKWSGPNGYEGYWSLEAKINHIEDKVYIDAKMTIIINYLFASNASNDKRQLILSENGSNIYSNSVSKISDHDVTYQDSQGVWKTNPGYLGKPGEVQTCYIWENIPIDYNKNTGETNEITATGIFISYHHDVNGNDLKGTFKITNIDVGGKISIKTGNNTWSKGQVYIKTGNNTWSEAKAVWVKTGNNTWSEAK